MHDNASGSRLSRKQLSLRAALAWARTRDVELMRQADSVTPTRLSLLIAKWARDHSGGEQALAALWMGADEVVEALLTLLRTGEVEAQGIRRGDLLNALNPIQSGLWQELRFNMAGQPYAEGMIGAQYERWDHLLFDEEHLLAAFPRTHATRLDKQAADRAEAERDSDPIAQSRWSIPMAVAWIASREPSDVQRVWDEFRHKVGEDSADLGHLSPIASRVVMGAWGDLRRAAEAGTVTAQGVYEQSGHGSVMHPAVWRDMAFVSRPVGLTCLPKGLQAGYLNVTFASAEIIAVWPAATSNGVGAHALDAVWEGQIQQFPSVSLISTPTELVKPQVEASIASNDPASDPKLAERLVREALEALASSYKNNGGKQPGHREALAATVGLKPGLKREAIRALWNEISTAAEIVPKRPRS